jgi:hypothetical protein
MVCAFAQRYWSLETLPWCAYGSVFCPVLVVPIVAGRDLAVACDAAIPVQVVRAIGYRSAVSHDGRWLEKPCGE